MNDLNEWLDSLSSNSSTSEVQTLAPSDNNVSTPQEESTPQALSSQDFDDILGDFGFSRPEDIEAEEVSDENNQAGVAGIEEHNWQIGFDSGTQDNEEDSEVEEAESEAQQADVASQVLSGIVVENPETIFIASASEPSDEPEQQRELLIPTNSPTLLMDESTTRFSGAEWYNEIQKQSIIIAGLGGIGSWLTLQLARMHPHKMVLYDDDRVEAVNMAGQMYAIGDVGKTKAGAMYDMIFSYTTMQNVYALTERFTANTEAGDVMMCGFDNMEARKLFFSSWHAHIMSLPEEEKKKCLYLDGIIKCLSNNL